MYTRIFKPLSDMLFAAILLAVLSPFFIVLMILVRLRMGKGIFFVHQRPGFLERPIHVIKFRTMTNEQDANGILLPNMQRITPLGSFMRATSLDEMPQLINVLRGDLSFIGPRPLEMRYLPYYSAEQRRRHSVRPGITGWAQVNGRNAIDWEEKFNYDLYYVDHISLILDMKILFRTIRKVLVREGVNQSNQETVIPFDQYMKEKNAVQT